MKAASVRLAAAFAAFVLAGCTSSGDGTGDEKSGSDWFQSRPLIMPGQHTTTVRSDPFGSLHVPTSESAYDKLSRAQQADLADALSGVDCAHLPRLSDSTDRVACDADGDVFLLGPPLFTGNDVTRADALAPTPSVQGWQVSFSLTADAANNLYRYTSQHHSLVQSGVFNDVQTSPKPPCGPTRLTPCSAFAAYLSDDLVVSVRIWFAAAGYTITLDGLDKASAIRIARRLNG